MPRATFDDETLDSESHFVAVRGELDLTNINELRRRVDAALGDGRARIVIDLTGVTHMDSSGLAELIASQQRAKELRGGLALVVTSPAVRRTLEIRGVRELFAVAESRDEALAVVAGRD